MSLATRCAACGTVFRVVQDQLKVSEGWVRCGRCGDVFNALEGLFDLDRDAPPNWTPSQRARLAEAGELEAADERGSLAVDGAVEPWLDPTRAQPAAIPAGAGPTQAVEDQYSDDTQAFDTAIDTRVDSTQGPDSERADDTSAGTYGPPDSLTDDDGDGTALDDDALAPTPSFLRQAEREERWRRPRVRLALALVGLTLAVALALQFALADRDALAARWPAATPALEALCAPLNCRVGPLRRLDALAVEASGLAKLEAAPLYRLSVALHNRGATAVMPPALELTLTDNRGDMIARRVLHPAELGATQASLAAGADLTLQAVLDVGEHRVAGYSVELFYP